MCRLLLLALLLGACSAPPAPRVTAFGHNVEGYTQAVNAGDVSAALALLRVAADAGDLDALATLATAYDRGYLSGGLVDGASTNAPIWTAPWTAHLARRRLHRELRRRTDAGDPEALFMTADALLSGRFVEGEWVEPQADVDSARAIYAHLDAHADDDQRLRLAFLARRLDDDDAYRAHLDAAADAGDPQACIFRFWSQREDQTFGVRALAAEIDESETCRVRALGTAFSDRAPLFSHSYEVVQTLRDEAGAGNAAAASTLDSLRTLGVFDRHERLAPPAEG